MEKTGAVVIGAGVVGLACARELAGRGVETIVVERHQSFGQETSSRNSEVIHAGLYYPPGTLKARLCVEGRRQLQAYCAARGIAHRLCGKLVAAVTETQRAYLHALQRQALANGVDDTRVLDEDEARRMEPALRCAAALYSPSTGIVDAHALMLSLLAEAEARGALFSPNTTVRSIEAAGGVEHALRLSVDSGGETMLLDAGRVVNAAGLGAVALARTIPAYPPGLLPSAWLAKGNYYALAGRTPFSRLIYPVPEPGGLGVHLTLDLGGQARFGPDVEWVERVDYSVDPRRAERFYAEIRKYWPGLPDASLQPAYSGIRPKISGPGEADADFMIQGPEAHGLGGLVNLFGIESPGLTACLAIARHVGDMLFR
ncbi:MAG: NAD(P)/FAD-dependent oxidoreductase [Candidatus Accumulibacter sp.]|nr:NAD(P)/FAD-dependent oxidoreductase [Accumulibacter sp.]